MNHKNGASAAALLALALILSGCAASGAAQSSAAATPTPAETRPVPTESPAPRPQYPLVAETGATVLADLDGDGADEEISYDPGAGGDHELHLLINGKDYGPSLYDQGFTSDSLEPKYFCITDLDTSDKALEVAVMDYGPSDDYITSFVRWGVGGVAFMGSVSGMAASSIREGSDLTFHGDGTVGSYVRLSVLQTWFAGASWQLSPKGGFGLVPADLYYSLYESAGVTLVPLPLYAERDPSARKTELPGGTAISFTSTDNKSWVGVKLSDGTEGWVRLKDGDGFQVETSDGYVFSTEAFDGLSMAD